MRLGNRVAIITGAGSGIGRAIALRFAEEGADTVIADIDEEAAQKTASLVKNLGRRALAVGMDVRKFPDIEMVVRKTIETLGRINILVNNAGVYKDTPLLETTEAEWDWIIDVNLKGTFFCTQVVAGEMIRAGQGGKIINLGSINSEVSLANQGAYVAAKGGVRLLTKSLALDLAPYGINVNAIGPSPIETAMVKQSLADPAIKRNWLAKIPLGRIGQPLDVANVALFLASQESDYITGTIIFVDGGWLIQ